MMNSKNEDTQLHVHPLEEENEANGSPDHDTSAEDEDEYPDGGWRAWSVVLGAWCALISTFGIANTVGVFEEWLASHQLHEHPKSTVSWIFSLFMFFLYVAGVQVGMLVFSARFTRIASLIYADILRLKGPIFDAYGTKYLLVPGSLGIVVSLMVMSVSTGQPACLSSLVMTPQSND